MNNKLNSAWQFGSVGQATDHIIIECMTFKLQANRSQSKCIIQCVAGMVQAAGQS